MSIFKKTLSIILSVIIVILALEIPGQLLYRLLKGVWVWDVPKQHDIFNVRDFTELVNDERIVTNKKNAHCAVSRNRVYRTMPRKNTKNAWEVITDENGFRVGANKYSVDTENIVFLGDSVPFGWGVAGENSVPSKFYELLRKNSVNHGVNNAVVYGVINAAIPSYSLYQSVKRYEKEIAGKFKVKCLILQIYDPAMQFAIWGRKWDKKMSWTSKDALVSSREIARHGLEKNDLISSLQRFIGAHSILMHAFYCIEQRLKKSDALPMKLDLNNGAAFEIFEKENIGTLKELCGGLEKENTALVILPVNITYPASLYDKKHFEKLSDRSKKILTAIDKLNETLKKFASTRKNVYYFDVVEHFNRIRRKGLYVDDSCHLSERGAEKQAEFIYKEMKINGLL